MNNFSGRADLGHKTENVEWFWMLGQSLEDEWRSLASCVMLLHTIQPNNRDIEILFTCVTCLWGSCHLQSKRDWLSSALRISAFPSNRDAQKPKAEIVESRESIVSFVSCVSFASPVSHGQVYRGLRHDNFCHRLHGHRLRWLSPLFTNLGSTSRLVSGMKLSRVDICHGHCKSWSVLARNF